LFEGVAPEAAPTQVLEAAAAALRFGMDVIDGKIVAR
jgi:hypothetical protein